MQFRKIYISSIYEINNEENIYDILSFIFNNNDFDIDDEIDVAIYAEFVEKDFDKAIQLYENNKFYIGLIIHNLHFKKFISHDLLYNNFLTFMKYNRLHLLHHYSLACAKYDIDSVLKNSHLDIFKAYYHMANDNFDEVEKYCMLEIEDGKYKTHARLLLGYMYCEKKNDKNKQFELFSMAATMDNDNYGATYMYAWELCHAKGNTDIIITLKCDHILFPALLGDVYLSEKKYDLAEIYYQKAIDSGVYCGLLGMGKLYCEKKNIPMAIEYYSKASAFLNIKACEWLGYVYEMIEHNIELAKKYYNLAIMRKSTYSMYRMGVIHSSDQKLARQYNELAIENNIEIQSEQLKNSLFMEIYNEYIHKNCLIDYNVKLSENNVDQIEI